MIIQFYSSFTKRENSTKRPSGTVDKSLTGVLKEPCSIMKPVIKIERLPQDANPCIYTYAIIPSFQRFYFVEDWTWADGLWEVRMTVDVLATWKTEIGNTEAYVERSASLFNGNIQDRLYPSLAVHNIEEIALDSTYYRVAPSGGCFVLGIINNWNFSVSQAGGAVTYYAMSIDEMRNLMGYLMSDTFIDDAGFPATPTAAQQLLQSTAKAFINPIQYITSCMWFPLQVTDIAEAQPSDIVLGYWELEMAHNHLDGHKLDSFAYTEVVEETIPNHPQFTRGRYLNTYPYTRVSLHIPPFGTIPIDTSYLALGNYMKANIYVDTITGKAQMRVTIQPSALIEDNQCVVAESTAMFGIPIQISQMLPDYLGFLATGLGVAGSVLGATSSPGFSTTLMAMSSIGNALDSIMPQVATEGVSGSFVQNIIPPSMTVDHILIADENNAEVGRPLCTLKTINTLSGFIKCGEVSINYSCFDNEKKLIHEYLMNGFFWE